MPVADSTHKIFDVMNEISDRLEPDGIRGAFERVGRPEQLIDQLIVLNILIQPQKIRFKGFQILLGLRSKIRQHFGIKLRN